MVYATSFQTSLYVFLQADDNGAHSQWHVTSVEVLHKSSGKQTSFPCGDWIQINSPVTLAASGAAKDVYQPYTVTVHTSDAADASFDGDVSLTLKGENGATSYSMPLGKGSSDNGGTFQVQEGKRTLPLSHCPAPLIRRYVLAHLFS